MSESQWYASYVEGEPPKCRRLNRLPTSDQWSSAIELAIAYGDGPASYRPVFRKLCIGPMTIEEQFWHWPTCPHNEPKDSGWWLIPRRIVNRAMELVKAATLYECERNGGSADSLSITMRLQRWRGTKKWQRVIHRFARRPPDSLLRNRQRQNTENPEELGYLHWSRAYLEPGRKRRSRARKRAA